MPSVPRVKLPHPLAGTGQSHLEDVAKRLAPQIIDRLNSYYGHAAIARLNIIQGPVTVTPSPLNPPPIKEEDISALADDFEEIETPRLKRALASLALLMRRDKG